MRVVSSCVSCCMLLADTGSPEDGQLWNRRNPPNNSMSHSQTQQQFPTPDT